MRAPALPSRAWILSVSLLLGGCACFGGPTSGGRPVREVYDEAERGGDREEIVLRPESEPGGGPRTRPVIYPPKVFAVYVQEHLDPKRDLKIGAHWVYFKLRDSSWFAEEIDREPLAGSDAAEADLRPLRAALEGSSFPRIVVPYRSSSAKTAPGGEESHEPKNQ